MNKPVIAIVGAGPAGIACCIQLSRYGFKPFLFEKKAIGGLLRNANLVENYPGFPEGIPGKALVEQFFHQLENHSHDQIREEVLEINKKIDKFFLKTGSETFSADIVILATGTTPKKHSLSIPDDCKHRVFTEVADLPDLNGNTIAIIGAGDAAFDYALNLAENNNVVILNRGKEIKSLPLLVERAASYPNIQYLESHPVSSIDLLNRQIELTCSSVHGSTTVQADYLLTAIGRQPNTLLLKSFTKDEIREFSVNKVLYQIGDIVNGIYRQTSIAAADGIRAAMQIYRNYCGEKA